MPRSGAVAGVVAEAVVVAAIRTKMKQNRNNALTGLAN
jgi:hypothetical protein